jgi:hypothetical protein
MVDGGVCRAAHPRRQHGRLSMTMLRVVRIGVLYLAFALSMASAVVLARQPSPIAADLIDLEAGCALPCFMGITPNTTTFEEAMTILEAHPWVERIDNRVDANFGAGRLFWHWSGQQPNVFIDGARVRMAVAFGVVRTIRFSTNIPFWQLHRAYGQSDHMRWGVRGYALRYAVGYPTQYMVANLSVDCPIDLMRVWQSPIELEFTSGVDNWRYVAPARLPSICRSLL